jgi:hypothetical protein
LIGPDGVLRFVVDGADLGHRFKHCSIYGTDAAVTTAPVLGQSLNHSITPAINPAPITPTMMPGMNESRDE